MTLNKLCFWIRFAIIAIAGCGLYLCIVVFPSLTSLTILSSTNSSDFVHWAWLVFLWIVSLPCFAILVIAWITSAAIKDDALFTTAVAQRVKLCSQILFIAGAVLFVGGVLFSLFRVIDLFIPIVLILVVSCIVVAVFLAVLSYYIAKAATIREENEGTI